LTSTVSGKSQPELEMHSFGADEVEAEADSEGEDAFDEYIEDLPRYLREISNSVFDSQD